MSIDKFVIPQSSTEPVEVHIGLPDGRLLKILTISIEDASVKVESEFPIIRTGHPTIPLAGNNLKFAK